MKQKTRKHAFKKGGEEYFCTETLENTKRCTDRHSCGLLEGKRGDPVKQGLSVQDVSCGTGCLGNQNQKDMIKFYIKMKMRQAKQ